MELLSDSGSFRVSAMFKQDWDGACARSPIISQPQNEGIGKVPWSERRKISVAFARE